MTDAERILEALTQRPRTAVDLADDLDIPRRSVYNYLKRMRDAGQIRVFSWHRECNKLMAIFTTKPGKDRSRPKPLGNLQAAARYREKNRARINLRRRESPLGLWHGLKSKI